MIEYNASAKFKEYKWTHEWAWLYGHAMHVESMARLPSNHHTILRMALCHLDGQSQLPQETQMILATYKTEHKIDTYYVGIPQQEQRGHEDHYEFIQGMGEENKSDAADYETREK